MNFSIEETLILLLLFNNPILLSIFKKETHSKRRHRRRSSIFHCANYLPNLEIDKKPTHIKANISSTWNFSEDSFLLELLKHP